MANQKKTITELRREIPVRAEVDVLVVGGGPAGIMAARADARATRLSKDCPSSSSTACVRGAPPANTVPASSM